MTAETIKSRHPLVLDRQGLDGLVSALGKRGYRVLGPVMRDGAIHHAEIASTDDLPVGWRDDQTPGHYHLTKASDEALFSWAVGPESWKPVFFPPTSVVFTSRADDPQNMHVPPADDRPIAIFGARPCDIAGIQVLDRVLGATLPNGDPLDPTYSTRRRTAITIVVECGEPSATCFCDSMDTGPEASGNFDIALTELPGGQIRYLARAGTLLGTDLLNETKHRVADASDLDARSEVLARARARFVRSLPNSAPATLARNIDNPHWEEVAERCLACGNCTLVCPTCFCSDIRDVSDVFGNLERQRQWASCFEADHSYVHGGPVRGSTLSRYRQWLTHKLSTWHEQFGTSGCVGCGRCITWCPVGIDLTEEVNLIARSEHLRHANGTKEVAQ